MNKQNTPATVDGERKACILCGKCLEVCPLFAATGREELSPRAKFALDAAMRAGPAYADCPRTGGKVKPADDDRGTNGSGKTSNGVAADAAALRSSAVVELAGKCLSCGRCRAACPLKLCAPDLIASLKERRPGFEARLWELWIGKAGVLWPLMISLARLIPRFSLDGTNRPLTMPTSPGAPMAPGLNGRRIEAAPGTMDAQSHRSEADVAGCPAKTSTPSLAADEVHGPPQGHTGEGCPARVAPSGPLAVLRGLHAGLRAMDSRQALVPWFKAQAFEPCGLGREAVVFPGCVASHARPDWTARAEGLLRGLDFTLPPRPDFVCCGRTLGQAGLKDAQMRMRRANLAAWRGVGRPELMAFCASCRLGLRAYVEDEALDWRTGERERWLEGLVPFSLLAARATYAKLPVAQKRVHLHAPCHGEGGGEDAAFLRSLLGDALSARTARDLCCGFGGALKLSAPELSATVAGRCIDFYGPKPDERILTGCSGCVIQLRANAPQGVDAGHWLETLQAPLDSV